MKKIVPSSNYTFDASAKTIVSSDFTSLEKILLITNVTDGLLIYNFADPAKGGSLAGTTLTLDYDTTSMDDADKIQIFVDDITVGLKTGGIYKSSPGTVADNQNTDFLTDEYGQQKVIVLGTSSSNVAQVNGTTTDTNSGNKSAGSQRIVIATDDVNTSAINTSTSASATSLAALDNSVDGNYLNTNMNIAGTDVDSNSGNKSAASQRVVIATDDVNTAAINTSTSGAATSLAIIDDWDESDRAKVNPIVGQAGVAAGTGNVSALTQRVVIATDQTQLTNALKVDGSAVTQPVSIAATVSGNLAQVAGGTVSTTGVTGQQKVGISDSLGNSITATPYGREQVELNPHQIFYDPFDASLDTTDRWTTPTVGASAAIAVNSVGSMTMGTGTTTLGWSKLTSQSSFMPTVPGWIGFSFLNLFPDLAAPTANSYRFWGMGTIATTPTVAAPMTDAVGFEITTAGKMFAVIYTGGVRTAVQDLSSATGNSTQPTNALLHRYIVKYRTDRAYFYIDGESSAQLVATYSGTTATSGPSVQTLPISFVAVGGATPPVSNTQIVSQGAVVWDASQNNNTLSDGQFQWRKATVKKPTTAAATGDTALVVALHPSSANLVTLAANQSMNNAQVNGQTINVGTGAAGTGTQRVTTSTDSTIGTVTAVTSLTQMNGQAIAMGTGARSAGTQRVTIATDDVVPITDNSGSLTVDAPLATPVFTTLTPNATGGWSTFMATSADGSTALTSTAQAIKGSAGTFGGYYIYNPNSAATYVHIYNVASGSVTVGTTNPQNTFCIPATSGANLEITNGVNFSTAMSCAATTTGPGNTAPTIALEANFWYK